MEFFVLGYKIHSRTIHILLLHVDPGGKYFRSESGVNYTKQATYWSGYGEESKGRGMSNEGM